MLWDVLPHAANAGVELHLETSLGPDDFAALLARLPHPMLKANYDSGNSSSLGYDVRCELAAYGPRIGSVHIKDRVRGGGTVPLGQGDADIPTLLSGLAAIAYRGDFVLQVARGTAGEEVTWARQNRLYLVQRLEEVESLMRILMVGLGGIGQRHVRNLRALLGDGAEIIAWRVRRLSHVVTPTLRSDDSLDVEKTYDIRVIR